MHDLIHTAQLLDDDGGPSMEDLDYQGAEGNEVALEPIHPPADEDHMLARMVGHGGRESDAAVEGEELLDEAGAEPDEGDRDGE